MIYYRECEELIGKRPEYPKRVWKWRAYKDGNHQIFDNVEDARNYSSLIEKVDVGGEEYQNRLQEYLAYESKVQDVWLSEMKKEFNISDRLFDICYSEAYGRGHSGGYDEVYSIMHDVVAFAEKISNATIESISE